MKILVADIDATERNILADCIVAMNHEPILVESKDAALAAMAEHDIGLLVLNPETICNNDRSVMDIMQICKHFRNIPVLVFAAGTGENVLEQCKGLANVSIITKPCDPIAIRAIIDSLLRTEDGSSSGFHHIALSLAHIGALAQFLIAALLISVVPPLALLYIFVNHESRGASGNGVAYTIAALSLVLAALGYVLLVKYPLNVIRLRKYLAQLAGGTLPDTVDLIKEEDDLEAIEDYMIRIIKHTEERVQTIERQAKSLIEAERQRAMILSLGAACHHLGQPATVITTYLELMAARETDPAIRQMIDKCRESTTAMIEIFQKLQSISTYRTEPYRPLCSSEYSRSDEKILKID
ncbi:MAG: response regulator [Lentisphaerae bacterium]|nr:response regulator [Lentisphaerota bacterium]